MKKENYIINQAVLNGNTNTPEFYDQIQRMAASIITKHYGKGIWHENSLTKELLSSALVGTFTALKRYNAAKGEFLSYARIYMFGEIHRTYCDLVFGLTPYYAAIRKHILEALSIYYETHNQEELLQNILRFKIRKASILALMAKTK